MRSNLTSLRRRDPSSTTFYLIDSSYTFMPLKAWTCKKGATVISRDYQGTWYKTRNPPILIDHTMSTFTSLLGQIADDKHESRSFVDRFHEQHTNQICLSLKNNLDLQAIRTRVNPHSNSIDTNTREQGIHLWTLMNNNTKW